MGVRSRRDGALEIEKAGIHEYGFAEENDIRISKTRHDESKEIPHGTAKNY